MIVYKKNILNRVLVGFILYLVIQCNAGKLFGSSKREFIVEDIMNCRDHPNISSFIHANIRKYNRTAQLLNSNVTLSEDLTDNDFIELEIKKWGNGGWKNNFVHLDGGKACSTAYKVIGEPFKLMLSHAGHNAKCPLPKGTYVFDNMFLDFSRMPIAVSNGRFLIRILVKKDKFKPYVCAEMLFTIK